LCGTFSCDRSNGIIMLPSRAPQLIRVPVLDNATVLQKGGPYFTVKVMTVFNWRLNRFFNPLKMKRICFI
jgi:hypothetical protein